MNNNLINRGELLCREVQLRIFSSLVAVVVLIVVVVVVVMLYNICSHPLLGAFLDIGPSQSSILILLYLNLLNGSLYPNLVKQ